MGGAAVCRECAKHRVRLVLYGDAVLHPEHIVHLVHLAPLVFVHAVNVGVHCERHRVVTEDGRQCFVIHASFQRTGGEGVSQGVKGKVPDVSIFQQAVVVILESFLLKVVTEFVGDDETIVGVLIPCPNLILRLLLFPAGKLVCYCAGQRNRAARVFRFGCAEYDFGFVLTVVGFVLGKAVDGAAYMELGVEKSMSSHFSASNSPIRSPVHRSKRINTP